MYKAVCRIECLGQCPGGSMSCIAWFFPGRFLNDSVSKSSLLQSVFSAMITTPWLFLANRLDPILVKSASPSAYFFRRNIKSLRNDHVFQTFPRQQDNLGTLGQSNGGRSAGCVLLQKCLLRVRQHDGFGYPHDGMIPMLTIATLYRT
jgi:hypothetical protein